MAALTKKNLLTPTQGRMVGWTDRDGVVHPNNGDGTLTTTGVYDAVTSAVVPVVGGKTYTAAVTVDQLAVVVIQWINSDTTQGETVTGWGNGRAAATGRAPATARGAAVTVWPGVVTAIPNPDPAMPGTWIISYPAGLHPAGMPYVVAADRTPATTLTVGDPILVRSAVDPGVLPVDDDDDSMGWRAYSELPNMYLAADLADTSTAGGRPLFQFLKGATVAADTVRALMVQLAAGYLTDWDIADDAWLPWLAQTLGLPATGTPDHIRALLGAQAEAPATGTAAQLEALVRPLLTGTQSVDVYPGAEPFTIIVRVRSGELENYGYDTQQLVDHLVQSGQFPAGFVVEVTTVEQTWAEVEAAMPTWAPGEGKSWGEVDSIGL